MKPPIVLFLLLILVSACSGVDNDRFVAEPGYLNTRSPYNLRALPQSMITAQITLNQLVTTHSGADQSDGTWRIPVNLKSGETYNLAISWFSGDLLLMEEMATFKADAANPSIQPDLDFENSGYQRFDHDCDGISNLDELIANTDPLTSSRPGRNLCAGVPDMSVQISAGDNVYAENKYRGFGPRNSGPVITKYEQELQIRTFSLEYKSSMGVDLYSQPERLANRGSIRLNYHPNTGPSAEFVLERAVSFEPTTTPGATCGGYDNNGQYVISCSITYPWVVDSWYTLSIEQEGESDVWTGRIHNQKTGDTVDVASIVAEPGLVWENPLVGIAFYDELPIEDCSLGGVPELKIQFKPALVNEAIRAETSTAEFGACVLGGGQWNISKKERQTEPLYSLSFGGMQ